MWTPEGRCRRHARGSAVCAEEEPGCRYPGACGDQCAGGVRHLVDGSAAYLADGLRYPVHPVQIGLAELSAVGIERQRTLGDASGRLAPLTEPELLQLHQHERREVVIE